MTERLTYAEALIANGQSASTEVDLRNFDLVGLIMPSWTAAGLSFAACWKNDGSGSSSSLTETFLPVRDDGNLEVTLTVAASFYVVLSTANRDKLKALGRTKLISGTNAVPVVQGGARLIGLVMAQTGD